MTINLMYCSISTEFREKSYQYTTSVLQKENERNLFPRQKAPPASFRQSLAPRSQTPVGSDARRDVLGSGYSSFTTAWQENAYRVVKVRNWQQLGYTQALAVLLHE